MNTSIKDKICLAVGKVLIYVMSMLAICTGGIFCIFGHDDVITVLIGAVLFVVGLLSMNAMLNMDTKVTKVNYTDEEDAP